MKDFELERVKLICESKSKSIREFSAMINVNYNTLNQQIKGERSVSLDVLQAILNSFEDISAEWLLRGKGEMYLQTPDSKVDDPADEVEILKDEILRLQGEVRALERIINGEKKALERKNVG